MANENVTTKVVIPCRFSYVHVWEQCFHWG